MKKQKDTLRDWVKSNKVSINKLADVLQVTRDTVHRAIRYEKIGKELAYKLNMLTGIGIVELLYPDQHTLIEQNKEILVFKASL